MKKLFFYLLLIVIIFFLFIAGVTLYGNHKVKEYRNFIKNCAEKESFFLSAATDFEWDRAVAFEFPVDLKELEKMAGTKIDFNYDVSSGIVFVNNGKIVFKDISDMNPDSPSSIIYELNDKHLSVYKKDTLVYVERYDDAVYCIKKAE